MDNLKGSEGSLLEHIQTKMKPVEDKATLDDLVQVKEMIPDASIPSMPAVPLCMFDASDCMLPDVMALLAWVQLKRENPDIKLEEVRGITSFHDREAFIGFMEKIFWFWADVSRSEFDERWEIIKESLKITPLEEEPEEEVADENPTPSESN